MSFIADRVKMDGLTFDDVLLIPAFSDVLPREVNLKTRFSRHITLNVPIVSAAMDTVKEYQLAIAIAREGGIGVIHKNMSIAEQARQVHAVKRAENGMIYDPVTIRRGSTVADALHMMEEYKAYVVFASTDSVLQLAQDYTKKFNPSTTTKENFVADMKKEFGRDIKVERVIASQGENPITDHLGFNGEKPDNLNQRWAGYFAFDGHVIAAPEEASDLKGAVVTDYQTALEKEWLDQLHKKHKVKINEKVLKQAK